MRRPNFFIVGAAKCGTTSMHKYLEQHPDIFMSRYKESLHFATDLLPADDWFRSTDRYLELFRDAGDEAVVGESSVYYMFSREAARNIRDYDDEARVIIMLRDPVEMLASYHAQLVFNGDEVISDLGEALEAEDDRRKGRRIPSDLRFDERLLYSDVMALTDQARRYLDLFPPERVHLVVYDDLRRDTPGAYRSVLEFLGVDSQFRADFRILNAAKRVRSETVRDLLKRPPAWIPAIGTRLLRRNLRLKLLGALIELNSKFGRRPPLDPALRRRLRQRFRPEVQRLGELVGRDLSAWSSDEP